MTPIMTLLRRFHRLDVPDDSPKLSLYLGGKCASIRLVTTPQPHLSWMQHPLSPGADVEVTAKKNTHPVK